MQYLENIKKRHSVRKYQQEPLNRETVQAIKKILESVMKEYGGAGLTMKISTKEQPINEYIKGFIGNYGKIQAPHYIIISHNPDQGSLLETGYAGEKAVLDLTGMGLGTCWIGGQFQSEGIKEKLGLQKGENVVALVALGKSKEKFTLADKRKRKKLEEIAFAFPYPNSIEVLLHKSSWLEQALEAVRIAPSAINLQPWRMVVEEEKIHFYSKSNPLLKKFFKTPLQKIDMGIAMIHLKLALKDLGIEGDYQRLKEQHIKGLDYYSTYIISQ